MPADQAYADAFESFLQTTNEKSVLLAAIKGIISEKGARSLLDIGPGNGDLSIPLSRVVEHYSGVELIEEYAQKLQAAGLHVLNQPFPTEILEHFDMVLACHVISLDETNIPEFLNAAWERLVPGGTLLIVTHSGAELDWNRLTLVLGQQNLPYHRAVFERILQLLRERGKTELRTIATAIESDSIDRMIEALGFVWSDGEPKKFQEFLNYRKAMTEMLSNHYRGTSDYSFPFEHSLIITTKP